MLFVRFLPFGNKPTRVSTRNKEIVYTCYHVCENFTLLWLIHVLALHVLWNELYEICIFANPLQNPLAYF